MKHKEGLGRKGSLTIVAVNPVNGATTGTVVQIRGRRPKEDVTRCSLHFLGPLSRRLLRRVKGRFERVIAVRSKVETKNVNDTILRFVTSRRCAPRVQHVNVRSRFMRRKAITRLCTLYKLSRRKVIGRLRGKRMRGVGG